MLDKTRISDTNQTGQMFQLTRDLKGLDYKKDAMTSRCLDMKEE